MNTGNLSLSLPLSLSEDIYIIYIYILSVAAVKVVNEYGHELAEHLYRDVGFLVSPSKA